MYAITNNHLAVLQWLITAGFDLEAVNESNTTPLMTAAKIGATDCVGLLLEAGANPDPVNDFGKTAISLASNLSIVRMLTATLVGEDIYLNLVKIRQFLLY